MSGEVQASASERAHPRVEAGFMVKVLVGGRTLVCKARDLSMAGLYLLGDPAPRANRMVVSIPLPEDQEILTSCVVRRQDEEGIALEFDGLDWDELIALARFLHPRLP